MRTGIPCSRLDLDPQTWEVVQSFFRKEAPKLVSTRAAVQPKAVSKAQVCLPRVCFTTCLPGPSPPQLRLPGSRACLPCGRSSKPGSEHERISHQPVPSPGVRCARTPCHDPPPRPRTCPRRAYRGSPAVGRCLGTWMADQPARPCPARREPGGSNPPSPCHRVDTQPWPGAARPPRKPARRGGRWDTTAAPACRGDAWGLRHPRVVPTRMLVVVGTLGLLSMAVGPTRRSHTSCNPNTGCGPDPNGPRMLEVVTPTWSDSTEFPDGPRSLGGELCRRTNIRDAGSLPVRGRVQRQPGQLPMGGTHLLRLRTARSERRRRLPGPSVTTSSRNGAPAAPLARPTSRITGAGCGFRSRVRTSACRLRARDGE